MEAAVASTSSPASKPGAFVRLLLLTAVVGLVVSLAAWGFLEGTHQIQVGVFDQLPDTLGFDHEPLWWPVPVLALAGIVVAIAIERLPGRGGHVPAHGLSTEPTLPVDLPGVILAAAATIGLGLVLGPEAPLIALGAGVGALAVRLARRDAPPQVATVVAASGSFAALAFIFNSPIIAAVILLEASGLDKERLPLVLIPGLLAAGIGSLVSIGLGSFTGLSTSAYAIGPLPLAEFARPQLTDILWTIPLAAAVAIVAVLIVHLGVGAERVVTRRPFVLIPVAAVVVAGLAIVFTAATDKSTSEVLFSGQDQLPGLIAGAGAWSTGALIALIAFKGVAWGVSLGSFRGGPTFPALFLGAAAGLLAGGLPGLSTTPAVAVGMGAAVCAVLRLPLSAVVLAELLTIHAGGGSGPLVIIGVVVAYLVTLGLSGRITQSR
jgi:chloride channel protein, CIC family